MQEIAEMLATAFVIGLTGALAPGPTLLATVNSSLQEGWKAGPKVAAGHALVEVLIFLIIVGGLASVMQQYARAISIVGGLALIAFGIMTAKESKSAVLKGPEGRGKRQRLSGRGGHQRRQSLLLDLVAVGGKRLPSLRTELRD